jgi:hypothetical protein
MRYRFATMILFLICTSTFAIAQSKKKDSFSESFECARKRDGAGLSEKTDSEMRDYVEFALCNDSYQAITGVIFIHSPQYYPKKEAGRYKIKIMPGQTGKPRFYLPTYNKEDYSLYNMHIGTIIYADGSKRNTIYKR